MTTYDMIKWLFKLAFPKNDSFEGWVATDQDDGFWECRFCIARKQTGWQHEATCKYQAVKDYLKNKA